MYPGIVVQLQTPDPLLVAGGWWLVACKTNVFQYLSASLLVKPMVFQHRGPWLVAGGWRWLGLVLQ